MAKTETKTKTAATKPAAKKKSTGGAKKKLTPYNKFIKDELARLKEKNPDQPHQERFKAATAAWASAKENPKAK